ncbi:alpha/beta fold hydrolase [Oleiagrimonas sp. C23AA]|nr:alpha/beta fold hydrolase [Oleiagrimonas sp. C23AA]
MLFRRLKMLGVLVALIVVLGGGSYLLAPQWLMRLHAWVQAEQAGLDSQTLSVGQTRWSYYQGGAADGPTIVLLHGYGADKTVWLPVAKQLTRNFHVIIPDLPGWGDSSRQAGASYNIDAQAQRLSRFVDALQLPAFILVGHSMGGAIAGVYAADHPQRVAGLALMDSFGLSGKTNAFARAAKAGNNPFDFTTRAGYARMAHLVFKQPPWLPGRFIDVLAKRNQRRHAFMQNVFNALRQPGQYNALDARLGKLTMPVIGIWCQQDKVTDVSALNTLRSGLTHATSIGATVINDCGHMPELEKPDATARIIEGFAVAH